MTTRSAASEPIVLGRVSGLHGVRGWVKVFSYTAPRQAVLDYSDCLLNRGGSWEAACIADGRMQNKTIVAHFEGVDDRDAAAALVGAEIGVSREKLPAPEAGRYYWTDLEGLDVVHRDGRRLGRVAYLLETGANDVLVVQGDRETLIPFVPETVILDVDLKRGVIEVDWEWA